jgi:hypothetical protein
MNGDPQQEPAQEPEKKEEDKKEEACPSGEVKAA